ncbi:saccharopine dehydrogenase NADP-binding domain-containing protein, partial [Azospirillum sp. B506]|uniref:saccharopine dehydrogenase NADP-binding domain-containing protein n=1 Tax=Azospirillum sp. B506 TaxID=137721 RepID=UPI0005B2D088
MTGEPTVGLLGGSGAVGRGVLRALAGTLRLRVGGRDRKRVERAVMEAADGRGECHALDPLDGDALGRFCDGCDVVVNCAGPSCRLLDAVALAALAAGAHYVDPGGDDPLHRRIVHRDWRGRSAVVSAGMLPGLSGLLPLDLVGEFDSIDRLTGYAGGIERFSPAGAEDFLASLSDGFGWGGMCVRAGDLRPNPAPPVDPVRLPLSRAPAEARPYISAEFLRLCRRLGVDGDWYNLFPGRHTVDFLRRFQAGQAGAGRPEGVDAAAVAGLIGASALDVAGRSPEQLLVIEATGLRSGRPMVRSIALRAGSGAALTGCVAACAVLAVLEGTVPDGVHHAADSLPVRTVLSRIADWQPDCRILRSHAAAVA